MAAAKRTATWRDRSVASASSQMYFDMTVRTGMQQPQKLLTPDIDHSERVEIHENLLAETSSFKLTNRCCHRLTLMYYAASADISVSQFDGHGRDPSA